MLSSAGEMFDAITYSKGGSVIRMVSDYIGFVRRRRMRERETEREREEKAPRPKIHAPSC